MISNTSLPFYRLTVIYKWRGRGLFIDKEKVRRALRELSKDELSREEKLRRIDAFLSNTKETEWGLVFSIMKEENIRLGVFSLKDLLILFLRFKDYKGLHQLKNRMYVISDHMRFLFSIDWRRFPIGFRQKGNHFYRPREDNPWFIENFYAILGSGLKRDAIQMRDIKRTTLIKRGRHFSSFAAPTIEKLHTYPNVGKYLLRHINLILRKRNGVVGKEVERIESELRPSYLPLFLDVPIDLVQILAERKAIEYSAIEQVLRVLLLCSQSEEEGKPVEMGIIIGNDQRMNKVLVSQSTMSLSKNLFLGERDWPRIREEISRKVNGKGAVLIVSSRTGNLTDVRTLPRNILGDPYCFLTHPLHSNAIAFLVKQSVVRVYYDGSFQHQLILNRKYGRWGCRNLAKICNEMKKEAARKTIKPLVLSQIIKICAKISEEREGALVFVGDFNQIEPHLLPESRERISGTRQKLISEMTEDEIIRLLREDGAVFFDKHGRLRGYQMRFIGPGGRHKIARYITEKCDQSLSIAVSQDNTITIYDLGKKWKQF